MTTGVPASTASNFSQGQWAWLHKVVSFDSEWQWLPSQASFLCLRAPTCMHGGCSKFSQCYLYMYLHIPDWLLITAVNRFARLAWKPTCLCTQWHNYGKYYSTLTHHYMYVHVSTNIFRNILVMRGCTCSGLPSRCRIYCTALQHTEVNTVPDSTSNIIDSRVVLLLKLSVL